MTTEPVKCDYCGRTDGVIQHVVIGKPGHLHVHEAELHADCEKGYVRLLDE